MTTVVQRPRYETTAVKIAELISEHGLKPGDRLPTERALGELLGVSRTVIREAVKMLATTGFVRARQGSGLYVAREPLPFAVATIDLSIPVDPDHIFSLFELRCTLEVQTARFAAERITPREVQVLDAAVIETRLGAETGDWDVFGKGDTAFHQGIAEATHNPLLAAAVATVHRLCSQAVALALTSAPGSPAIAAEQHAAILAAIRQGQGQAAADASELHLQTTVNSYRQEVRRRLVAHVAE